MSSLDPKAGPEPQPHVDGPNAAPGLELRVEGSVASSADEVWDALFEPAAMARWIRPDPGAPAAEPPTPFSRPEAGSIRILERRRHLRLTWRPDDWPGPTTLGVRIRDEEAGCRVEFHQEEIPGEEAREGRRAVLQEALDALREGPGIA